MPQGTRRLTLRGRTRGGRSGIGGERPVPAHSRCAGGRTRTCRRGRLERPGPSDSHDGRAVVARLAERLTAHYGRGYSRSRLFRMVQFAAIYESREILATLSPILTWSARRARSALLSGCPRDASCSRYHPGRVGEPAGRLDRDGRAVGARRGAADPHRGQLHAPAGFASGARGRGYGCGRAGVAWTVPATAAVESALVSVAHVSPNGYDGFGQGGHLWRWRSRRFQHGAGGARSCAACSSRPTFSHS